MNYLHKGKVWKYIWRKLIRMTHRFHFEWPKRVDFSLMLRLTHFIFCLFFYVLYTFSMQNPFICQHASATTIIETMLWHIRLVPSPLVHLCVMCGWSIWPQHEGSGMHNQKVWVAVVVPQSIFFVFCLRNCLSLGHMNVFPADQAQFCICIIPDKFSHMNFQYNLNNLKKLFVILMQPLWYILLPILLSPNRLGTSKSLLCKNNIQD